MTSREIRNRKDRNQRIRWWAQDILGVACLFGIGYGMLFLPLIFN